MIFFPEKTYLGFWIRIQGLKRPDPWSRNTGFLKSSDSSNIRVNDRYLVEIHQLVLVQSQVKPYPGTEKKIENNQLTNQISRDFSLCSLAI
jgi:hypothetical protein